MPNRDATIIDSYDFSDLKISGTISFTKFINGIPLIDLTNNSLTIDISLNLSNIYTGCDQYPDIYNLYDLYLYGTTGNVLLTLNEPWIEGNSTYNTKELNLQFSLDYEKITESFIYSRTSQEDKIYFSIDGTYGSNINKRIFSNYNDGFKNKFFIEISMEFKKPLYWDYTYSGFNYENNLYYPSAATDVNGNFLLADPTDNARQFKVLSDFSDNILLSNQLMWANGGFVAGSDENVYMHPFANPYEDYTSDIYYLSKNITDIIDISYAKYKDTGDHLKNLN